MRAAQAQTSDAAPSLNVSLLSCHLNMLDVEVMTHLFLSTCKVTLTLALFIFNVDQLPVYRFHLLN